MKRTNTTHANAPCPKTIRLALTVAILAALTSMIALAADAAPAPSPDPQAATAAAPAAAAENAAQAAKTETQTLEGMVVTGSASNNGVKKIDASYIITAVNAEQIKQANPKSTADLLKVSPGLWPESTGGQTGANIEIAGFPGGGDAPYFTTMMMGSPLYGAPTLSFFETTSAFRLDDTIERAEIVQGGPTVVLGPGQIGATANFILKQGTSEPSGSIGITYGDEGLWRLDGFYGFKIADGWYGSIGGFWRTSDGVRSPGFKADQGGQLTATLTHDLDNGSFTLYARRIDDKNQFITPIPLHQNSPGNFSAYPGFDPLTSTYYSKAMQNVTLQGAYGPVNADLGNGRGAKMNFFGGNFDYEIAGWSISDKFLYNEGDMNTNALFSGNNTKPLSYYLYGCNIPNGVFCGPGGKPLDSDNLNLAAGTPYSAVLYDRRQCAAHAKRGAPGLVVHPEASEEPGQRPARQPRDLRGQYADRRPASRALHRRRQVVARQSDADEQYAERQADRAELSAERAYLTTSRTTRVSATSTATTTLPRKAAPTTRHCTFPIPGASTAGYSMPASAWRTSKPICSCATRARVTSMAIRTRCTTI